MTYNNEKLPISVVIITLNESGSLGDCLASVDFAEDIVVVDSGSTDDTVAIAEKAGARVFYKEWLGFGQQKNYGVERAKFDWVFCIDADERVDGELQQSIRQVVANQKLQLELDSEVKSTPLTQPVFNGYRMARRNYFLGRGLKHGFGYPDLKVRFIDRRHGRWTEPAVHEYIAVDGPVGHLQGDLLHYSGESIQQFLEKNNRYTTLQASTLIAKSTSWPRLRIVVNPILCFIKGYFLKRAFLDGIPGLVHTVCHCFTTFAKYVKLYEHLQKEKNPSK
ncbi:MAG: glycosyltransferase family 2 protein [Magnetococcales bacterium]|nr:glycosyltransferase family 2 protein [Magnetococcales bacterium]